MSVIDTIQSVVESLFQAANQLYTEMLPLLPEEWPIGAYHSILLDALVAVSLSSSIAFISY